MAAFSPDGKTLASSGPQSTILIWDVGKRQVLTTITGYSSTVLASLAFSPDGKTLASASWDPVVKLWDTSTWQELAALNGHSDFVFSVAFSPDGRMLATAGGDTVRLWIAATKEEVAAALTKQ
jgi:WD40 repeat protein